MKDVLALSGQRAGEFHHYGVLVRTGRGNFLVFEHRLVVLLNLALNAGVGDTGVRRDEFSVTHLADVIEDARGQSSLHVDVGRVVGVAQCGTRIGINRTAGGCRTQLGHLAIDAAQVLRQALDALGDKLLGVARHGVLVVDSVLVIRCDERVQDVDSLVLVVPGDIQAQHVAQFVGLLGGEVIHDVAGHGACGVNTHNHLVAHVALVVVFVLGDGDGAEGGVHLVAKVGLLPAAVAVDLKLQVVGALGHDGHRERLFDVAQRRDLHRRVAVDVHVAQKHVAIVLDV